MKQLPVNGSLLKFALYVQERARANDTFKAPRFVVGPSAYNFMLWHLCEAYDPTGGVRRALEAAIEDCKPFPDAIAKECLVVVAGPGQNNRPFRYNHFLTTATRTHLVLTGSGTLTTQTADIKYREGDVFTILPAEMDTDMCSSDLSQYSTHVVVMWTESTVGPVWEAYSRV